MLFRADRDGLAGSQATGKGISMRAFITRLIFFAPTQARVPIWIVCEIAPIGIPRNTV